jgi:DNA invertase Pin-like site-specific DNA recombinase
MIYGYARVSTDGQSVAAQVSQLKAAGARKCSGMIRARTGEGRKLAKARGVRMGRKPKLIAHQQREALQEKSGALGRILPISGS